MSLARRAAKFLSCVCSGFMRGTLRLGCNLLSRRPEPTASVLARTCAEVLQSLGPTYVKIGQLLAARPDLLSRQAVEGLSRLLDKLPPISISCVEQTWLEEFGETIDSRVERLELVASASVASVFRGRLADGRTVAIKVRRPGIAELVEADARLLRICAKLLVRLPPFHHVPLVDVVEDLFACIRGQLDFRREAASCARLRNALSWEPGVLVPMVVDDLSGESVVTMQFVDGLSSLPLVFEAGHKAALRSAVRAFYRMVFVEGLVHCDLHPGNLHLLSNGKTVILDFGFTAELSDHDRLKFAEFFYAMAIGDGGRCADVALSMAQRVPDRLDVSAFRAAVSEIVSQAQGKQARDFQVARFVAGIFDVQRRHRVMSTSAFAMVAVGLVVLEGLIKQVEPELDFQAAALPFIFRASISSVKGQAT